MVGEVWGIRVPRVYLRETSGGTTHHWDLVSLGETTFPLMALIDKCLLGKCLVQNQYTNWFSQAN